jgi:acyl carrier protein
MSETVAQKVIATIAKSKRIPVETITLDSKFEELKIDSLDGLNLFFDLEEAFDITIPDDRARHMRTVREVVEALELLLSGESEPPASPSAAQSE